MSLAWLGYEPAPPAGPPPLRHVQRVAAERSATGQRCQGETVSELGIEVYPGGLLMEVDPDLTPLEACVRYSLSNVPLQAIAYLRSMPHVAEQYGYERTSARFGGILEILLQRTEPAIRQSAAVQLADVGEAWVRSSCSSSSPEGEAPEALCCEGLEELMGLAAQAVRDQAEEVRHAACDSLAELAYLSAGGPLLPRVTQLLRELAEDSKVDVRGCVPAVLERLAARVPTSCLQEDLVPMATRLAGDTSFVLRAGIIPCLVALAERQLPGVTPQAAAVFRQLASDRVWAVRKAAAAALSFMAAALPSPERVPLASLAASLCEDRSHWVRDAMMEQLGPLLVGLDPDDVTDPLLKRFAGIPAVPQREHVYVAAARSLLPLLRRLSAELAWPSLSEAFECLAANEMPSVREEVAAMLPGLAAELGERRAQSELLAHVSALSDDVNQSVRLEMAHGARDFMACIPYACRPSVALGLQQVARAEPGPSVGNWRLRETIAWQLADIAGLVDVPTISSVVEPCCQRLLRDPAAAVRFAAACSTSEVLVTIEAMALGGNANGCHADTLGSSTMVMHDLRAGLAELARSPSCNLRQAYVQVAANVLWNPAARTETVQHLVMHLVQLARDAVLCVRTQLAAALERPPPPREPPDAYPPGIEPVMSLPSLECYFSNGGAGTTAAAGAGGGGGGSSIRDGVVSSSPISASALRRLVRRASSNSRFTGGGSFTGGGGGFARSLSRQSMSSLSSFTAAGGAAALFAWSGVRDWRDDPEALVRPEALDCVLRLLAQDENAGVAASAARSLAAAEVSAGAAAEPGATAEECSSGKPSVPAGSRDAAAELGATAASRDAAAEPDATTMECSSGKPSASAGSRDGATELGAEAASRDAAAEPNATTMECGSRKSSASAGSRDGATELDAEAASRDAAAEPGASVAVAERGSGEPDALPAATVECGSGQPGPAVATPECGSGEPGPAAAVAEEECGNGEDAAGGGVGDSAAVGEGGGGGVGDSAGAGDRGRAPGDSRSSGGGAVG